MRASWPQLHLDLRVVAVSLNDASTVTVALVWHTHREIRDNPLFEMSLVLNDGTTLAQTFEPTDLRGLLPSFSLQFFS